VELSAQIRRVYPVSWEIWSDFVIFAMLHDPRAIPRAGRMHSRFLWS
jgi:hypothetical protein